MGNYLANSNAASLSALQSILSDLKSIEESRMVTRFESQSARNALASIDDPNLHLAIQSLDALLNKVLHEKAQLKAKQEEQLQAQEQQHKATLESINSPAALASSLAQMLNHVQLDSDYQQQNTSLALSRRTSNAMAPLNRCPMETNRNHQERATTNKVNYKNLFPRTTTVDNPQPPSSVGALFGNMFSSYQVEELNSMKSQTVNSAQRRSSQLIKDQN